MVTWFCCSALCTNNLRTRNPQGESIIKFHRLSHDPEVQAAYTRILQTTGINWYSGHICAQNFSCGYRENASTDFPDSPASASQLKTLEKTLKQAKAQLEGKEAKAAKQKVSSLERKLFLAKRCSVKNGKLQQAMTLLSSLLIVSYKTFLVSTVTGFDTSFFSYQSLLSNTSDTHLAVKAL